MAPPALSPEWWRDRLLTRYRADFQTRSLYQTLYDSRQASFQTLPNYSQAYSRLIGMARTPWARMVVDIVAERLAVIGLRISGADVSDTLWELFKLSRINALQSQVYREAINLGTSYASIWPQDDVPKMAWESALTVTHELEPGDTAKVAAAVKVWEDTIRGQMRVNLYLPDSTHKWVSNKNNTPDPNVSGTARLETLLTNVKWEEVEISTNSYGTVPIVPFSIRSNWDGYGRSDLDDLSPVLSRIENLTTNILLAVELGAFRQRWATGIDVPRDPNTDDPVEPFKVALDRLWVSEAPDAKFGSFEATDITGYLKAVSDAIGQLSAVSRIPVTYFVQSELANPPSAASLEASETGLINKVIERQEFLDAGWDTLVNLAVKMARDIPSEAEVSQVTVLWKDARTRSEAQVLDAATKLNAIGAPWESVMEFIGYKPDQIARMRTQRMRDTFERLLNAPPPQAPQLEGTAAPGTSPTGTAPR